MSCEHDWTVGDVAPRLAFRLPKHVSSDARKGRPAGEISVAERHERRAEMTRQLGSSETRPTVNDLTTIKFTALVSPSRPCKPPREFDAQSNPR